MTAIRKRKTGSSPCVWGQAPLMLGLTIQHRIIPMRVGTRTLKNNLCCCPRDHPHACGDKFPRQKLRAASLGSSPCVWGQVILISSFTSRFRIIPMRVGTSHFFCVIATVKQDHPHACGDKKILILTWKTYRGSSPCVWGQARAQRQNNIALGIIPMRVGTRAVF